jgi:hypothetical protein
MKQLYQDTKLVIIPMKPTSRTQGLVVFMEAAAMNKRVIASRVSGLVSAYNLKMYKELTLVAPQNSEVLKKAIVADLKKSKYVSMNSSFRDSISTLNAAVQFSKILNALYER